MWDSWGQGGHDKMLAMIRRLGLALIGTTMAMTGASAQQFTMKLSQPTINDTTHEFYKALKAGVEARAGGRIKLEIYPANQLGQLPAVVPSATPSTTAGSWPRLGPRQ